MTTRSAHSSIRGYWAQLVATALAWARLKPGECLVVEGNEDYDKELRTNGNLAAVTPYQHKDVSYPIGWDAAVQQSVLGFTVAFERYHRSGVSCFPTYVSTSTQADVEVLDLWTKANRDLAEQTRLESLVSKALREHELCGKDTPFGRAAKASILYLDSDSTRWRAFINATRWTFGAPQYQEAFAELENVLRTRPDTTNLPNSDFALRVTTAVVDVAVASDINLRKLSPEGFAEVVSAAKRTIEAWAQSPQSLGLFDDLDFDTLLRESEQRIDLEYRRGAVDQRGGPRAPRPFLESQLETHAAAPLRVVVGERGSGKTSLIAKWAREEMQTGRQVIWLRCRTAKKTVEEFFRDEQRCRRGAAALDMLAKRGTTLVLDALDQGREPQALSALCEVVERATGRGVRTIAIARLSHTQHSDVKRILEQAVRIDVGPLSSQELTSVLAASAPVALQVPLEQWPTHLRQLASSPLNLHFIWELALGTPALTLGSVSTLATLMHEFWNRVVKMDDEPTDADTVLRPLVEAMLRSGSLTAAVPRTSDPATIARLVRADVLQHPSLPGFGSDDARASFVFDAVFDFAVFYLLWRTADDAGVAASLGSSGLFATGLDRSFRYLLEYRGSAAGADAAIGLACLLYSRDDITGPAKEMIASEVGAWTAVDSTRQRALIRARVRKQPGAAGLLTRLTTLRLPRAKA